MVRQRLLPFRAQSLSFSGTVVLDPKEASMYLGNGSIMGEYISSDFSQDAYYPLSFMNDTVGSFLWAGVGRLFIDTLEDMVQDTT